MRFIFILLLKLFFTPLYSQTFDRWAQIVNWDGVSHWSRYMITQPGYQGPNSLPVPRIGNGSSDSSFAFGITGNLHFSSADNTQNITVYANYSLVKDLVSIDLTWVPYEHYVMSQGIKDKRHVFTQFYNSHSTTGDIHFNTTFQLLNKWRKSIHLAFRVGYRFPSGSGFGAARYTDGPGYHFDLSIGKPFKNSRFKWISMIGFYVWQIESDVYNQNDAFLVGSGLEWNKETMKLQTYVAGYMGYLENTGDDPFVFRAGLEKRLNRTTLLFGFQQGLHDFDYTSVEFGAKYNFHWKNKVLAK